MCSGAQFRTPDPLRGNPAVATSADTSTKAIATAMDTEITRPMDRTGGACVEVSSFTRPPSETSGYGVWGADGRDVPRFPAGGAAAHPSTWLRPRLLGTLGSPSAGGGNSTKAGNDGMATR